MRTTRQRTVGARTPRRGAVVAIALVLSVVGTGVMLAQRTPLSDATGRQPSPKTDGSISLASIDPANPSKEYIYAGGMLIATEEPTGGPPTHHGSTIGLFRPSSTYFLLRNSNTTGAPDISAALGATTDRPVVGDWDGNGTTTIGVFRPAAGSIPNTFYLSNASITGHVDMTLTLGAPGDLPVVGDWDGNGTTTIGVFRPSTNTFFLCNSLTSGQVNYSVPYGAPNLDLPIVGDWDGNGTVTVGLYRPSDSTFYLRNTNSTGTPDLSVPYGDGPNGDKPLAGDWDGV